MKVLHDFEHPFRSDFGGGPDAVLTGDHHGRNGRYLKLALIGFLLYFSNYVAFVTTWASVGLFILWQRDLRLIRNFIGVCAAMAVVVLAAFWVLHSEFAGSWPPETDYSLLETYQRTLVSRGKDFWRHIPLAILVPAGL